MSNKTPPLVIPVVVDTTGVTRGINDVDRKLRYGRRGGSGGGSGGGFGTGGNASNGVGLAGGIAAGAVAGAVAGGGFREVDRPNPNKYFSVRAMSAKGEILRSFQFRDPSQSIGRRSFGKFAARNLSELSRETGLTGEELSAHHAKMIEQYNQRREAFKEKYFEYKNRAVRRAGYNLGSQVGGAIGRFAGLAGVAAVGVGAMQLGRGMVNFEEDMLSLDRSRYKGSEDFGRLRQMQERARQNRRGEWMSEFMLGANQFAPEGGLVENVMRSGGQFLGADLPRGLGRMAERPISGTLENLFRMTMYMVTPTYGGVSRADMHNANMKRLGL
jgi:hypothetical protein